MFRNFGIFVLVLVGFSSLASAQTTLEFDVQGTWYPNRKEVKIDIDEFNRMLNRRGLEGLPSDVVVGDNAAAYGKVLKRRIEAAEQALDESLYLNINGGYIHDYGTICYRGNPEDVPAIIKAMSGTFLRDDQGILAIRYRSEMVTYDRKFRSQESLEKVYDGGSKKERDAWFNYDQRTKAVLVMSNLGPQGDGLELYATSIKACE